MRILFMGTPDFALFSLRALVESGENVIGVVTQPDKPRGRGYTLTPPPVKVYASKHGINVYQPQKLRGGSFDETVRSLDPEVIVVTAYGKILPVSILDYPKYGCINIHGSLLPEYRGAAPMQRAIMEGRKVTGVTVMQMDAGMDTGDMLLQRTAEIGENDNFEDIHDRLGKLGADALIDALAMLKEGKLVPVRQDENSATYAAKIEKSDCLIDFSASALEIHNRIRGLSPFPLAYTHLPNGKMLKIVSSRVEENTVKSDRKGMVVGLDGGISVQCAQSVICFLAVLPEGKGRMKAEDYINGHKISVGDILG